MPRFISLEYLCVFVAFWVFEVVVMDCPLLPGVALAVVGVLIYRGVDWVMRRLARGGAV